MKRSRFSEEQIIAILREQEAGAPTAEVCRRHGMRLIGAVLFEQNDEWQTSSRYMMVEAFAQIDREEIDPILIITTKAA
jgi:hypothetical protein